MNVTKHKVLRAVTSLVGEAESNLPNHWQCHTPLCMTLLHMQLTRCLQLHLMRVALKQIIQPCYLNKCHSLHLKLQNHLVLDNICQLKMHLYNCRHASSSSLLLLSALTVLCTAAQPNICQMFHCPELDSWELELLLLDLLSDALRFDVTLPSDL